MLKFNFIVEYLKKWLYIYTIKQIITFKINIMNTFTITFKNALGELKTEIMQLDFCTVNGVMAWFEETLGLRVKSISKH